MFITNDISHHIVKWANIELTTKTKAVTHVTNGTELYAFIGLLTLTGAMKNNSLTTEKMFGTSYPETQYSI